jgi:hypothetical protein
MRLRNATVFAILAALCALFCSLMWRDVARAVSSGKIQDGKYSPYVIQAVDPIRFEHVYYNHFGTAVILTLAATALVVCTLVSLSRGR